MSAQPNFDPNEHFNRQNRRVEHDTGQRVGAERARQQGIDPQELMGKEWIDAVNDLDVDRKLPNEDPAQHNIEKKLGAHKSKQLGIGFITRDEYERENLKDRGRRRLMNSGFRRRGGTGSECKGRTRARMTGGESDKRPLMDADLSDQMDAGMDAKRYLRSGSINGKRFRGSTEIQVVNRSDGFDLDTSGKKGLLNRFTGGFLG